MNSDKQEGNSPDGRAGSKIRAAQTKAKVERGFAAMDPKRQREIASEGGKAAHLSGNAHQFTSEEAREAGRKGGQAGGASDARKGARTVAKA